MHLVDALQADTSKVQAAGAVGVEIQWLLDDKVGTPNFAMRRFLVEPEGQTPYHTHDWEHRWSWIGLWVTVCTTYWNRSSIQVSPNPISASVGAGASTRPYGMHRGW